MIFYKINNYKNKQLYISNNLLLLSDFAFWQSKKKLYTKLMEKFINGIIDGQKFEEEFYQNLDIKP